MTGYPDRYPGLPLLYIILWPADYLIGADTNLIEKVCLYKNGAKLV